MIFARIRTPHIADFSDESGHIRTAEGVTTNPTSAWLAKNGWYPFMAADNPQATDGMTALPVYTVEDGAVVQTWATLPSADVYATMLAERATIRAEEQAAEAARRSAAFAKRYPPVEEAPAEPEAAEEAEEEADTEEGEAQTDESNA